MAGLWEHRRENLVMGKPEGAGGQLAGSTSLAALPAVSSNPWLLLSFNASFEVLGNRVFFLAGMNKGF